jgi:hypothetical protein
MADLRADPSLAASSDLYRIGTETVVTVGTCAKARHWGAGRRRGVCIERDSDSRGVENAFETRIRAGNDPIAFSAVPSTRFRSIAFSIVRQEGKREK